jgi:prepilin-type N-terminal cleavage/methylation domain-containing protein
MPPAKRHDSGFTLVEVLVALVVSSFLLVIVLDGSVTARSRLVAAEQRQAATLLAADLIATAAATPFQTGARSGVTNGLNWRVTETVQSADRQGVFGLVKIEAEISAASGRAGYRAQLLRLKLIISQ